MSLSIDQLESLEALERIEPEWRELRERDPAATPFESPEWLLPWTRHLSGGGKLRVLAVRNAATLAGFVPFFHWGYGAKPEIVWVSLLGSGISDHPGMLAARWGAIGCGRRPPGGDHPPGDRRGSARDRLPAQRRGFQIPVGRARPG